MVIWCNVGAALYLYLFLSSSDEIIFQLAGRDSGFSFYAVRATLHSAAASLLVAVVRGVVIIFLLVKWLRRALKRTLRM
jgi:hypothetical protein